LKISYFARDTDYKGRLKNFHEKNLRKTTNSFAGEIAKERGAA